MLKNLFLYLKVRPHVGRVVGVATPRGMMPLVVQSCSIAGLSGAAVDDDVVHMPWSSVTNACIGPDVNSLYRDGRDRVAKRLASRDDDADSKPEPLFKGEDDALAFLRSAGID